MKTMTDIIYGKTKLFNHENLIGQQTVVGKSALISENRKRDMHEIINQLTVYETYQPGFTYSIKFDSDAKKLNLAFATVFNQLYNLYGCEGQFDAVSLIVVDNNLEKLVVSSYLSNFAFNYGFRFCESVETLNFCANGVCLVTLDELPKIVEKLTQLNNARETNLLSLQVYVQNLLEQSKGLDRYISDLDKKEQDKLLQLINNAEIDLNSISPENLYNINEQVETTLSYLQNPERFEYETKHFTVINEGDNEEEEQPILSYNYKSVPIGCLFMYSGYIYNIPEYYQQRKYLLDFIKALTPNTFIWTEYKGQSNYIPLEDYSCYPVRNIFVGDYENLEVPYFLSSSPSQNFERITLDPLADIQDLKQFAATNGFTINNKYNNFRISPGKLFIKLRGKPNQIVTALALAQLKRNVLLVVNDVEQTINTIEQIIELNDSFKGFARNINIINAKQVLHYVYNTDCTVIDDNVEVTPDLLAHLVNITNHIKENGTTLASGIIVFDNATTEANAKNASKRKHRAKAKPKKSEATEDSNLEVTNTIDQQVNQQINSIYDYLRDRRIEQRVPYEFNEVDNIPAITDNCMYALDYFALQERRNWNSQLSGDKFLTVRCNNREISYYPNLSNNSFVLAGFNNHFFDNSLTLNNYRNSIDSLDLLADLQSNNLNLNSGDFITNISIAIHRIINTFANRKHRVLSSQHINVAWLVNSEQTELLPLYEKLFSNIFHKEEGVNVNIHYINKFCQAHYNNNVIDYGELQAVPTDKEAYRNILIYIRNFIPFYHEHAADYVKPEFLVNLDINDSVDNLYNKFIEIITGNTHTDFINFIETSHRVADTLIQKNFYHIKDCIQNIFNNQRGQSNIFLGTVDEYVKYSLDSIGPDIIVLENCFDLYRSRTAANFANNLTSLIHSIFTNRSVILVSSPESDTELLLKRCEEEINFTKLNFAFTGYSIKNTSIRTNNINIALNQSSAERFAYVVNFELNDFAQDSFWKANLKDYDIEAIVQQHSTVENNLPFASLNAFTMPLSAYRLPRQANSDYRVIDKNQLSSEKVNGYIPALGEKEVEIQIGYHSFTKNKILNTVLSILTASKNSKSRGLLVVNKPELKALFKAFSKHLNFQVHDFNSIQLERAVFSHAVILAHPLNYVEQAIVQHVALLTRGFKTTGSIFLICNSYYQSELLGLLASSDQNTRKSRVIELLPTNILANPYNKDMITADQISPHFFIPTKRKGQDIYYQKELPGVKAYINLPNDELTPEMFGKMDPNYIRSTFGNNIVDESIPEPASNFKNSFVNTKANKPTKKKKRK